MTLNLDWAEDFYDDVQETLNRLDDLEKERNETTDPVELKRIQGEMEELENFLDEQMGP